MLAPPHARRARGYRTVRTAYLLGLGGGGGGGGGEAEAPRTIAIAMSAPMPISCGAGGVEPGPSCPPPRHPSRGGGAPAALGERVKMKGGGLKFAGGGQSTRSPRPDAGAFPRSLRRLATVIYRHRSGVGREALCLRRCVRLPTPPLPPRRIKSTEPAPPDAARRPPRRRRLGLPSRLCARCLGGRPDCDRTTSAYALAKMRGVMRALAMGDPARAAVLPTRIRGRILRTGTGRGHCMACGSRCALIHSV